MSDDEHWSRVADELKQGILDEGLWLKARTLTDGPKETAERAYIMLRIEQLKQEAKIEADRQDRARRVGAKTSDQIWEILHSKVPDMDKVPREQFSGLPHDLHNPMRASFIAQKAKVHEFVVVDAIKAKKLHGIFDGEEWWVAVRN
ncbi:MAG: hypothetical protein KDM91_07980 [Verrucomicrobiae bacterium]|nr:hypothetical protein [Verrucomicrobiae bacterium]MCP5541495.1 hypothetical protein [Akkermansiaceae bacterium]MCP5551445.1 hypothetical protein [Akkermansiaceae bacterium]